uniref:Uncharacterized protein n=1 Tax=Meloidogyne enterolobii TaxID=390850 RepID=A0A6V7W3D4_MELEN|nr:unnamed protein product [Meloidogyne enterolobii]
MGGGNCRGIQKNKKIFIFILIILIILLLFLFLFVFIFFIKQQIDIDNKKEEKNDNLWGCTYLNCSLNTLLDPCDDFYDYVCYGFVKNTSNLPEGYTRKSQFNILWEKSYKEIIDLLNNKELRKEKILDNSLFKQMFQFYDSCLNNQSREEIKSQPLLEFIEKIIGGSGAVGRLRKFETEWILKAFPFVPFFDIETTWDVRKESLEKSMFMLQPKSPFSFSNNLWKDNERINFENKLKKILRYLIDDSLEINKKLPAFMESGLNEEEINLNIERRVKNLILVEQKMSKAFEKYSNTLQRFSNWDEPELYLELGEISSLFLPSSISIDFVKILNEIASEGNPLINEKTKILILGTEILKEYRLIIEWAGNEDGGNVLSDYLDWALIWRILYELDFRFSNLLNSYKKDEIGCVRNFVRIYFKHWLDKLYVEKFVDKKVIGQIENIFSFIKQSFGQLINEANWIGDESKNKAKIKLSKMKQNIGYYKLIEDLIFLNKLYKKYKIEENMSWIEMFVQLNRNYYLWPTIDYQASFFVDGYYKWAFNSLAIYGGIMHSPWFDPAFPGPLNFGGIGTLLGHEVSHGFDSSGFHFDENGDRIEEKDVDKEMNKKMEEKFECFIEQYNNYENNKLRPSTRFTLSENIADNAGIRASYKAWKLFTTSPKKIKNLNKSLNQFTDEQIFFIGNAFTYCSVMTEEDKNNYAKTDNHAFPKARVNLPLSNFQAFAKAFECSSGTKMNNNEQKCQLW